MVVTLRQTKSSDHDAVIHSRRTRLPTLVATTYRQRTCPGTQVFPWLSDQWRLHSLSSQFGVSSYFPKL